MTYAEKLKDPRWQKKRLEIMGRDEFTCQICKDNSTTLHVHHKYYIYGNDPWDYEDNCFLTLCADCHESEEMQIKEYSKLLIDTFKKSEFMADDWREIAFGVKIANLAYPSFVVATLIKDLLMDKRLQDLVFDIITSKEYKL